MGNIAGHSKVREGGRRLIRWREGEESFDGRREGGWFGGVRREAACVTACVTDIT